MAGEAELETPEVRGNPERTRTIVCKHENTRAQTSAAIIKKKPITVAAAAYSQPRPNM